MQVPLSGECRESVRSSAGPQSIYDLARVLHRLDESHNLMEPLLAEMSVVVCNNQSRMAKGSEDTDNAQDGNGIKRSKRSKLAAKPVEITAATTRAKGAKPRRVAAITTHIQVQVSDPNPLF